MSEEARLEKKKRILDNRERRMVEHQRVQAEIADQEELERHLLGADGTSNDVLVFYQIKAVSLKNNLNLNGLNFYKKFVCEYLIKSCL